MGALNFALPSVLLYLLPLVPNVPNLGNVATTAAEQLNNFIDIPKVIVIPKEIHGDNGEIEIEPRFLYGSLDPFGIITPVIGSVSDAAKLNVGFQAKVESRKDHGRAGISTNVHLANQAKWSGGALLDEHKASKELSTEEERAKSRTGSSKDRATEGNGKEATVFHLYIPDINDREKFAKTSMQLGLDVATKDADGSKAEAPTADSRAKRRNFIRLCKRLTEGPTASLMQKLYGKICVKLPRSEFYLEQGTRMPIQKDGTTKFLGLKIGTKTVNGKDYKDLESGSDEYKEPNGTTDIIETSISDGSINYDESSVKVADKLGTGLNIKMPMIDGKIANLLRNNKLSLSAALK